MAYSPIIHRATLITKCDLISPNYEQIFSKIVALCSGCTSMTSLMKRMVSRDANVDLPSNFKN
jgi:hypothetical protein